MPRFLQRLRPLHQPDPSKSVLEKGRICLLPSSSVVNIPAPGAIAHMCWVSFPKLQIKVLQPINWMHGLLSNHPRLQSSESLLPLLALSTGEDERLHSTPPWLGEELLEEAALDESWATELVVTEVEELLDDPSESVPVRDSAEALEDMNAFQCSNIESIREWRYHLGK